jgi:2-oxoglutarate dehydrogenase E2 component (dihydrolipoamide succinyltransferase)
MDIVMPQLGETVTEGTVSVWYKKPGDAIKADESLFEVETDKVSMEIPSPVGGLLREILVEAGATVKVGTRVAIVDTGVVAPTGAGQAPARSDDAKLSPVVRRLLAEANLSPDAVPASGRDGRITREDVLAYLAQSGRSAPAFSAASSTTSPAAAAGATSSVPADADDRIVALNKVRRATAAHMVRSVATSPHTLQAIEVDFHHVDGARRAHGERFKAREGVALTYLPFVCAAVCEALAEFPYVNASFTNDELIVHRRVHLGIAVDLSHEGLLAPVLRDANRRTLQALVLDLAALVARTRANQLGPDELKGGTYTISNSGSFGTLITAPIINQPQVAILSTDGVHKKPVVVDGPDGDVIAVRPVGVLAQSFDHRAFDGAYSAAFLRRVKQSLESRDWLAELG